MVKMNRRYVDTRFYGPNSRRKVKMRLLKQLSKATSSFLADISDRIDDFIYDTFYDESLLSEADIRDIYSEVARRKSGDVSQTIVDANDVIRNYPGFIKKPFEFPERLGHMDLEVIEVEGDDMFRLPNLKMHDKTVVDKKTGEKKSFLSNDPAIATTFNRRLDDHNGTMLIGMRDCFSFIREIKFEMDFGLPKKIAEEALTQVIGRIMKETDWTFEQVLLALLMRDILMPTVIQSSAQSGESLHDTIRLYHTAGNSCRWAVIPYHSPSLDIGELMLPGDENFPNEQFGGENENDF